jgi:hypothetical protein
MILPKFEMPSLHNNKRCNYNFACIMLFFNCIGLGFHKENHGFCNLILNDFSWHLIKMWTN